jgi:hypothetical protein
MQPTKGFEHKAQRFLGWKLQVSVDATVKSRFWSGAGELFERKKSQRAFH